MFLWSEDVYATGFYGDRAMEIDCRDGHCVAEGKVREDWAVHLRRRPAEKRIHFRERGAIGELSEEYSRATFEKAVLFQHGQHAVEFVDGFVQILEDQNSA